MVITVIKISDILGYHPVAAEFVSKTSATMFALAPHECSKLVLENLLKLHPIHIVKEQYGYQVIAGFRCYEMACLLMEGHQEISCLEHDANQLNQTNLSNFALSDIIGSMLLFECATNPMIQTKNLERSLGEDTVKALFGRLSSKQKIDVRNKG